ncbi:MAG TPA: MEDS domain-containing protein [Candidatus Eremiobacteraceae bacterium]|nr:MEDS domain-containing protein [Candidatus Eremiobacteraceae bacterium]
MSTSDALLGSARPGTHLLQFYSADPGQLARNVAKYFADGFELGYTAVLLATREHREAILDGLKSAYWSPDALQREGLLHVFDAERTLASILVDDWPDPERFETIVAGAVRNAAARIVGAGVRAFGELVGVLWNRGQFPAAIRLEQMWNNFQTREQFSLYCAYPVDPFGCDFESGIIDPLLCAHTDVVTNDESSRLHTAIDSAMRELLDCAQRRRMAGSPGRKSWASLPPAESAILWLRTNAPDRANDVIARARQYYEAGSL